MSALGRVVRAGVGRRRVQSVVMALTTMTAVAASIMAGALVIVSQAPFDHAFGRQHGAHLTGSFDGRKATFAQVAATAHAAGVTAAAGPYAVVSTTPRIDADGLRLPEGGAPLAVTGRADPHGPVDDLTVTSGHWATGPGQIVLDADHWTAPGILGGRLTFPGLPGSPRLTVVGLARSLTSSAGAWVAPAQIAALTAPGATPSYEMLYRFSKAGSSRQIAADRAAVKAAVPAGALTGAQSYLVTRQTVNRETATFVPFVVAFGVLGLVMSVLIVGIVVSGAVSAGTQRIGVLKSLGFTPGQVGRAYVGQALIPALVGAAAGVVLGDLGSVPLLGQAESAYRTGPMAVSGRIDVAVPAGVLALTVLSALTPALRAARLRTVEALAVGRTPRVGRGRTAALLAARLPLPRAVTLGLAGPFARPVRSATIGAAIVLGALGVTFAYGLGATLDGIQKGIDRDAPGQVQVLSGLAPPPPGSGRPAPSGPPSPPDSAAVGRLIAEQPGTRAYFGSGSTRARFAGIAGDVEAVAYQGTYGWGAYQMVSGHWIEGPGQIVVAHRFLQAADARVGDSVTLLGDGRTARVRIVGEALTTGDGGMRVLTDAATLTGVGVQAHTDEFSVELKDGTDRAGYLTALNRALRSVGGEALANSADTSSTVVAMDAITVTLTLMLILVAGLGVLNTAVLDTRERVHDLGVLKALGMAPRQTVAMVLTSVGWIGTVAGLLGVPTGIALHAYVLPVMGEAAGTRIPSVDLAVYHPAQVASLACGGLLIALLGAVLPAGWAARTPTATSLRTE
ncbi:FtsX-like permease family protein [Streptomyces sp. V4-01]|uniref:FtsX-like permease family protein n=1 Tax=Actinacidiphila polyblastidii TaxID=3110430 RepID=A0ABU7PAV5_9ACTN|nr:FtsX-like permease family protein [Streptomyces sp. V4-01]